MKKLLVLILVMLFIGIAYPVEAQNAGVSLTCGLPTTNADTCRVTGGYQGDICQMDQVSCEAQNGVFTPGGALSFPITNIKAYYGTVSGALTSSQDFGAECSGHISGLNYDTDYYFTVTAYNQGGESCKSPEIMVHTKTPGCNAPTGLRGIAD